MNKKAQQETGKGIGKIILILIVTLVFIMAMFLIVNNLLAGILQ